MALKTDYTLATNNGYEHTYEGAYLKVVKIVTSNTDYEYFETVNDPDHPEIDQKLSWVNRIESEATVYVWSDEVARKNRAQVVHWFSFTFDFDLNDIDNVYEQAYKKLHKLFENSEFV